MKDPSVPALPGLSKADIERAQLPALYIAARDALQACARVDECKDLQDKFTALARYARQARNQELLKLARKISLRATRRMGELIHAIPKYNTYNTKGAGRAEAAQAAGISESDMFRALAIARVPQDDFEGVVETDDPPSREAYADRVRKRIASRPQDKRRGALAAMRTFARYWDANPPETFSGCFTDPADNAEARELLGQCHECIRAFAQTLTVPHE